MTEQRLTQLLCLDQPNLQGPEEGTRLEYKVALPDDIGRHVAAMANTFGGTIIVGISCETVEGRSKRKFSVPKAIVGEHYPGNEPKLYITQKIVNNVRPRPRFEVQPILLKDEKYLVIITVEEGEYPPYEYEAKKESSIPIRIQDSTRIANLQDLEILFAKRATAEKRFARDVQDIFPSLYVKDTVSSNRAARSLTITAIPRLQASARPDRSAEQNFKRLVGVAFFHSASGLSDQMRTARYFQVESISQFDQKYQAVWGLYEDGSIGFSQTLPVTVSIGDVSTALSSFFQLCEWMWSNRDYYGRFYLDFKIEAPNCGFTPQFLSTFEDFGQYDTYQGIAIPSTKPLANHETFSHSLELDFLELGSEEQVADCLFFALRHLVGANISFEHLLDAVTNNSGLLRQQWRFRSSTT